MLHRDAVVSPPVSYSAQYDRFCKKAGRSTLRGKADTFLIGTSLCMGGGGGVSEGPHFILTLRLGYAIMSDCLVLQS